MKLSKAYQKIQQIFHDNFLMNHLSGSTATVLIFQHHLNPSLQSILLKKNNYFIFLNTFKKWEKKFTWSYKGNCTDDCVTYWKNSPKNCNCFGISYIVGCIHVCRINIFHFCSHISVLLEIFNEITRDMSLTTDFIKLIIFYLIFECLDHFFSGKNFMVQWIFVKSWTNF